MVSHDRRTSARRVAKIPAPGQGGKDDVLQSRTDESQGYLSKHKTLAHDSGSGAATMFPAAARCWFILIARIPVEQLETHRKCLAQDIGWIVKRDRLLILTPVPVPR